MPVVQECPVLENDEVAPQHFRIHIEAPAIAKDATPAQFCMLQVHTGYDPLLRRPMSFERIHNETFTCLYKIEGRGTRLLASLRPGQSLSVQGPLGNGFPVEDRFERHIIVAGGIGVAPFPALAESIVTKTGKKPEVIVAARSKALILCAEHFNGLGCPVHVATDDGSLGTKANAAQMLETLEPGPNDRIYVCGPMIMMAATSVVAVRAQSDCLVALESQMACGDGACLGCVVESKTEHEGERMVRVCADGPVFDTTTIDWEAHNAAYDR